MSKYFLLWEMDRNRTPVDHKERGAQYDGMVNMVKQYLKNGLLLDHGLFVGEGRGYAVFEGSEAQLSIMTENFVPFVNFEVHAVAAMSHLEELVQSLTG